MSIFFTLCGKDFVLHTCWTEQQINHGTKDQDGTQDGRIWPAVALKELSKDAPLI